MKNIQHMVWSHTALQLVFETCFLAYLQQNSRITIYDFVYCGICKNPKYQQEIIIHAREIDFFHVATNMFGSTLRPLLSQPAWGCKFSYANQNPFVH
jgi:hypothetical protein